MRQHNIAQVFVDAAAHTPDAVALVKDGQRITYQELLREVEATAAMYRASGINAGDKLLVFVPISIDLYRIVLALFYIGAVPVFLDAWVKPSRLLECLKAVPCKGLIAPRKLLWLSWFISPLRQLAKKFPAEKSRKAFSTTQMCDVAAEDTALITFTTGSTSTPKAADRTHGFLAAQLAALSPLLPAESAITLTMLPIVVLIQLALSRTTVLPPKRYKSKRAATFSHLHHVLQQEQVELFITSPAASFELCQHPQVASVRHLITGGGPVSPQLAALLNNHYPATKKLALYGSTEAEPIAHLNMAYWDALPPHTGIAEGLALGTVDAHATVAVIPVVDSAVSVADAAAWPAMCLPVDAVGEIVVSGAHVLQHYLNNPEAERLNKIRVDGVVWHRTGDAGRLGKDGLLYFYGRCSEIIEHEGKRIFPVLVDDYLRRNTGTAYTALLPINGRLTLVIEKSKGFAEALLGGHLQAIGLSGASVIYMKALPKDPRHQSKIDYARLRMML